MFSKSHKKICYEAVHTLRQRQNGHHFADDTFKLIFLKENFRITIKISLKFVPNGPINDIPVLVQIMAWRGLGDRPLSEPMVIRSPTHICVTQPQWVKEQLILNKHWENWWPDALACHLPSSSYASIHFSHLGKHRQLLFSIRFPIWKIGESHDRLSHLYNGNGDQYQEGLPHIV